MNIKLLKSHLTFEGQTQFWEHDSQQTQSPMKFSTFIPAGRVKGCLIWLSGLTCNEENFITKAGAQKYLADHHLMVICPDTSPRGLKLPGEEDDWDFGVGASFYVNAEVAPYKDHYKMYSYIVDELYELIQTKFAIVSHKISIMGHSMGGHGALIMGLREPEKFQSISAFAPITNPVVTAWGQKAFRGFLGNDTNDSLWKRYDACEVLKASKFKNYHPRPILIDQGSLDPFYLQKQLLPENFKLLCELSGQKLDLNMREGYDHSYYFISTFLESHVAFHASHL